MLFAQRLQTINAHYVIAKALNERTAMGKAISLAERLRETKSKFHQEIDAISTQLDEFDRAKPQIVSDASSFVESLQTEVKGLGDELRQLANVIEKKEA